MFPGPFITLITQSGTNRTQSTVHLEGKIKEVCLGFEDQRSIFAVSSVETRSCEPKNLNF